MIKKIEIAGVASYPDEGVMIEPKKVNYIFGANGTGKTTISRVIKDHDLNNYENCKISWKDNVKLDVRVFNRDFFEENFDSTMKGIFTLGSENIGKIRKIEGEKKKLDRIKKKISTRTTTLEGMQDTSEDNDETFKETCWTVKTNCPDSFDTALDGFRKSKATFCKKVLEEFNKNNLNLSSEEDSKENEPSQEELEKEASIIFAKNDGKGVEITPPEISVVTDIVTDPIWNKSIIGSSDTYIAGLIKDLNNSDWVNQGRKYLDHSGDNCPFCQQNLPHNFANDLEKYFDKKFEGDLKKITYLILNYQQQCSNFIEYVENLSDEQKHFLGTDFYSDKLKKLNELFRTIHSLFQSKEKKPSEKIKIPNFEIEMNVVLSQIQQANDKINNLNNEKTILIDKIWKFICKKLYTEVENYHNQEQLFDSKIEKLKSTINAFKTIEERIDERVKNLEREETSIQPTIDEINDTLEEFGFSGFFIEKNDVRNDNMYRLVRSEEEKNDEIHKTLSEGERNFITFLYFYQLVKGGFSAKDTDTPRVVVFDDPMSSLDSNTVFIVSTLIRKIVENTKDEENNIKQVFILTHNIFFYKEVSFNHPSGSEFFVVRKPNKHSTIKKYNENPIKSEYENLWMEFKSENISPITLPNTMRRIIEYYFKLVGGTTINKLTDKFSGKDKCICQSLVSWMHGGSHSITDQIYVSEPMDIKTSRRIFEEIFDKTGHIEHYNMMMGKESSET
jgi:wobble nucleotide-excising tRNase